MKLRTLWRIAAVLAVVLLVWEALYLAYGRAVLAPPEESFVDAFNLLCTPKYWPDIMASLTALAMAYAIAAVSGVVIGTLIGGWQPLAQTLEPMLVASYTIPKVVIYPAILLLLGIGLAARVTFGVLHGIIPIMIFCIAAVRNVSPVYIRAARTMRLTPLQMFRHIWIPAAVPEIFTGLRIGFSLTILGIIFAEFFGSRQGLGFLLMNSVEIRNVDVMMSIIVIIVGFALISNAILFYIDRRLYVRKLEG